MLPLRKRSVLVVDDNADLCKLIAAILRADGFQVDWCVDADAALENVRTHDYSTVLIEPSPQAGFAPVIEYLATNRADGLHTVVFATTEEEPMLRIARSSEAFTVLRKPLTRRMVTDACGSCVPRES